MGKLNKNLNTIMHHNNLAQGSNTKWGSNRLATPKLKKDTIIIYSVLSLNVRMYLKGAELGAKIIATVFRIPAALPRKRC